MNDINNNEIYEIKYVESYTFSDFIFFKIKNIKTDSDFYAISEKVNDIDSLRNKFEKVKIGYKYNLKIHKLLYPYALKSRTVSFFDDENGRIWEKDTMKVDLFYIENMKDQYLITK